jgi:hypothetical protein
LWGVLLSRSCLARKLSSRVSVLAFLLCVFSFGTGGVVFLLSLLAVVPEGMFFGVSLFWFVLACGWLSYCSGQCGNRCLCWCRVFNVFLSFQILCLGFRVSR